MVPAKVKREAINFLFPDLGNHTKAYKEISQYIEKRFGEIRCCVLYALNEDFAKIASKYNLDLCKKEVLIANGHVSVTKDYEGALRVIMRPKPFDNPKKISKVSDNFMLEEDSYCVN